MFNNIIEPEKLNVSNVLKHLKRNGYNEIDLCKYYITGFKKINTSINSDLRNDDNNASLHVTVKNNKVLISDFGYKTGMSIFNYIQEKYFTNTKKGYLKALDLVRYDFRLSNLRCYYDQSNYKKVKHPKPIKYNEELQESNNLIINIKERKWENKDTKFWNLYYLNKEDFSTSNIIIKAISKFRIINTNKNTISEIHLYNNLSYAFCIFYNDKWHYKIYSPLGIDGKGLMKWVSNITNEIILGKTKPKSNKILIIQSSVKDKVLITKMGYYALPLLAEGIWFNNTTWNNLRAYFEKIIYFANNDWEKKDNPGLILAKKHNNNYNIDLILTTPQIKGVSDISDYVKKYNYNRGKLLVDTLIQDNLIWT